MKTLRKQDRLAILKGINFGELDGWGDPNLDKYFLDNDYYNSIARNKVFFVIGRKGTGKSAIYRMIKMQGNSDGDIIENADFGNFPFEKLLRLDDKQYMVPNQYQSIWKQVVLNCFAKMISRAQEDDNNVHKRELERYVSGFLGDSIADLHKVTVQQTKRVGLGIQFSPLNADAGNEYSREYGIDVNNQTALNIRLENTIIEYFKTRKTENLFILQFDRLDDNYGAYLGEGKEIYFQSLISLCKVVYLVNQAFRAQGIESCKVILYVRSDLFAEIAKKDPESARWDDFVFKLSWSVANTELAEESALMRLISLRIAASSPKHSFDDIFLDSEIAMRDSPYSFQVSLFKYMLDRSHHRPRDIVKFCTCIQQESVETNDLTYKTVKSAEISYAVWFLRSEIANEVSPIIKDFDALCDLLALIGKNPFTITDFAERYRSISNLGLDHNELANYLYDIGVFLNYAAPSENSRDEKKEYRVRSSFRNEGKMDRNMKLILHRIIWIGVNR